MNSAPESKRVYRLRSYVSCLHCLRRLFGNANHAGTVFYGCQPKKAYRPDGHPPMFRVREDELLVGLNKFLVHEGLRPLPSQPLRRGEGRPGQAAEKEREDKVAAIGRALRDNRTRSTNLLRSLEAATEVSRPLFEALRLEIHYDYETRTAVCRNHPDRRHGRNSRKGRNRGGRGPSEATLCS
ncbi:hypothetical protein C8D87_11179 [Lentzea atacamensis]|uniref:Recombinase zinc beta ribbon domain-containing protein n=1 Tax=Lentzea atacamensis TaxID=531938 RepID=A0ABX9DYU4_9PSEU|nr:hypothetical protein [Lentzea atacamensis]RAS60661.1 hypothetical protein C8D87_11179 [Lentzea atacamensis]